MKPEPEAHTECEGGSSAFVRVEGSVTCDCLGFVHPGRRKHVTAGIAAETVRATVPVEPRSVGEDRSPERIAARARITSLITGGRR